jgi:hypothetical protein
VTVTKQVKKRNERGLTRNTPQNATMFSQLYVNLIRKEKLVLSITVPFSELCRRQKESRGKFQCLSLLRTSNRSCGSEKELAV